MTARLPDRRPQKPPQEQDKRRREQSRSQKPRPELILLNHRCPNRRFIILQPVEQHDIEPLMEHLIIRNADNEEQGHQADSHTPQDRANTICRPTAPDRIGNRPKHKRNRHQERCRLQTDPRAQPKRLRNISHTGTPHLTSINQQESHTENHEQRIDVQE